MLGGRRLRHVRALRSRLQEKIHQFSLTPTADLGRCVATRLNREYPFLQSK